MTDGAGYPAFDPAAGDARLDAPAFHRNAAPLLDALTPRLQSVTGDLLEIGSGSGQHAALIAERFPALTVLPGDPDPRHRASIDAWARSRDLPNMRPAADLDAAAPDWSAAVGGPGPDIAAILCVNVIHIAPWRVAEGLFRGAGDRLAKDGFLALYGPFRFHGRHIGPGNAAFDHDLRRQNPDWGVRDIDDVDALAHMHGLARSETLALPANNHVAVFTRRDADHNGPAAPWRPADGLRAR